MQLLKPLTLLLFVLVSVNSFAQSYKVTVKEVQYLSCKNENAITQRMCLVGVDNTELTPLCGTMQCDLADVPLNLPPQVINSFPTELSFPAAGMLETLVDFDICFYPVDPAIGGLMDIGGFYGGCDADPVKGTFRLPPFTLQLRGQSLPNPGECETILEFSTKNIRNRRLQVAANQITQVLGILMIGESGLPADLVPIPHLQNARMKTNFNQTIPLGDIRNFWVEICNLPEIQGFIDISYAFRTLAAAHSASWDFSGGLRVSAKQTGANWQDYVGTIGVSAMIFSSDVDGALINAEEAGPDTISTTFRYKEDSDPNDNILGWMEIDFSSLSNQQWQPFELEWVVDGRTIDQEFTNVYAIGLGQLLKNSPGSSPLSMKLPVIEQGGDPMTLTVSGGGHPLTIEYALFGASGN